MRNLPLAVLCVLFLLPSLAPTQQPPASPEQPFLLLASNETKKLQTRLTEAAKAGYRVVATLNSLSYENLIFLEKSPQPEPVEYLLLGISRVPTAQKELNQGAAQGFRLLPHTLVMTGELVGIMEKLPSGEQPHEYLVINTMRSKSFEKEIQRATGQGWQLCWLYRPEMQNIAIFERPAGSPAPVEKPPEIKDADMRFRLFSPLDATLDTLAAQGYRVVMAPRQANDEKILMEKTESAAARPEYRVIVPKDAKKLEESLTQAGADGFRLRWPVLFYVSQYGSNASIYLFAEKVPGARNACEYRLLSWATGPQPTTEFSERLSQARARGFRAFDALVWDQGAHLLVLEKCRP